MKNLFIDCQILQTGAIDRGMGNYVSRLIENIDSEKDLVIKIVINKNLEISTALVQLVAGFEKSAEVIYEDLPTPAMGSEEDYKKSLDALMQRYAEDTNHYLITSLFTFNFFAVFPESCVKLLLFYDLTPLILWRDLGGYFPPAQYMGRFATIYDADITYAISNTTKNDLANILGIDKNRVVNINGGHTNTGGLPQRPTMIKNDCRFVLFPTGDLPHKNNEFAIQAFLDFNLEFGESFNLVVTSNFHEHSQYLLSLYSDKVIFTGNVNLQELDWLYENCEAVLLASKYEGLGLPALDSLAKSKPVILPSISVFKEMSKDAFYFFSLEDQSSLSHQLGDALSRTNFAEKEKKYKNILKKYTWKNSAKALVSTFPDSNLIMQRRHQGREQKKIAIVSRHPGFGTGIAVVSEPIYGVLHEKADIDYYFDPCGESPTSLERPTYLDFITNVHNIQLFSLKNAKKYSKVIILIDEEERESIGLLALVASLDDSTVIIGRDIADHGDSLVEQLCIGINCAYYDKFDFRGIGNYLLEKIEKNI